MAQLALPSRSSEFPDDFNALPSSPLPLVNSAPTIEMIPNLSFSFPCRPVEMQTPNPLPISVDTSRRPMSMPVGGRHPRSTGPNHRRGASTLPSFTFNSTNASGLGNDANLDDENNAPSSVLATSAPAPLTPSRHKRYASELVGGDSRFGVSNAISSSPTRTDPVVTPSPSSTALGMPPLYIRGHGHRRSVAVSSHDLSNIMFPTEEKPQPNLSTENVLSNTPEDPFGPTPEDSPARPESRPRVGFSDNIEFIPRPDRPLSTISSGTEGTMSTLREHSVNNSISSMLSLSTPSPPAARARTTSLETTFEEPSKPMPLTSPEVRPTLDKEGTWLKRDSPASDFRRPLSEPLRRRPRPVSYCDESPRQSTPATHKKRLSVGYALGLDRRRSEPLINIFSGNVSDTADQGVYGSVQVDARSEQANTEIRSGGDFRSTTKKFKEWAKALILRKNKEPLEDEREQPKATSPLAANFATVSEPPSESEPAVAETNLDAVLGFEESPSSSPLSTQPQRVEFSKSAQFSNPPSFASNDTCEQEEGGSMLDLDAALGPFQTPPLGSFKQRKELHSNRLARDFGGPGGHYSPVFHRRAESAPMMPSVAFIRNTPPQAAMADVFEEDEEEDAEDRKGVVSESLASQTTNRLPEEESNPGVQIVDVDPSANASPQGTSLDDGLRINSSSWEPERSTTVYGAMVSRLSMPIDDRRASSLIEETIVEEPSPIDSLEIVEAHEEPREPSLTKSSESSETPTILAGAPADILAPPDVDGRRSHTPETHHTSSAFSTPDYTRRQSSFDTTRIGTSASSMTDNRTISSCTTTEQNGDPSPFSSDDVPSLTSSRSTMMSVLHVNSSRRDISGSSGSFGGASDSQGRDSRGPSSTRTPSIASNATDEYRRKRASIQSLSQLVGAPFGSRTGFVDASRPQTAAGSVLMTGRSRNTNSGSVRSGGAGSADGGSLSIKKKDNRLSKLLFWRKHRQASSSSAAASTTSLTPSASMTDSVRPSSPLAAIPASCPPNDDV